MHVCWQHEPENPSKRSRSQSRDRRGRSGDHGLHERDGEPGDGPSAGRDPGYQLLLDELREIRGSMPKEKDAREEELLGGRDWHLVIRDDTQVLGSPEFGEVGHVGLHW